ncbi:MAG: hypothetical protein GY841_02085 [FCB group bacterium]|nr:hypothetical protein [FCB group bacterium]
MKLSLKISLLTTLIALMGVSLMAQTGKPRPKGPRGQHGRFFDKEMAANFENLRLLKLLEVVELTEEQSVKFIPLFHGLRNDVKELRLKKVDILDQMREAIARPDNEAILRELLDKLAKNKSSMNTRMVKFLNDCEPILTIQQIARLAIFQEHFEREILNSLREFRRGGNEPEFKNDKQGKI